MENKTELEEAMGLVTVEMMLELEHGDQLQLTDNYCLYRYTDDDIYVLNQSEEWDEIYTVMFGDELTGEVIFEEI